VQTPVQAPLAHAYVQDARDVQAPLASQLCGVVPEHCVAPGAQVPEQVPDPVQTYGQVCVVVHWPEALQVCDAVPLQRVAPAVQTPVHAPLAQANWHAVDCHWPLASQVSALVPVQRVEPGAHTPPQVPDPVHA
jgi:hypothetical protein